MVHDPKAYLFDIKQACDEIANFTRRMDYEEYSGNPMVKAAVERKFLMIGEALLTTQPFGLQLGKVCQRFDDRWRVY